MKNPKRHRVKLRQILSENQVVRDVYQSLLTKDREMAHRYLKLLYTQRRHQS